MNASFWSTGLEVLRPGIERKRNRRTAPLICFSGESDAVVHDSANGSESVTDCN